MLPVLLSGTVPGGTSWQDAENFVRLFQHEFDPGRGLRGPQTHLDLALVLLREGLGGPGGPEEKLSQTLMDDLVLTLVEKQQKPRIIVLFHSAVKLATSGTTLENLRKLEAMGVRILVNRTSLMHYGLEREIRVGEVATMMDIVAQLLHVAKVVSL